MGPAYHQRRADYERFKNNRRVGLEQGYGDELTAEIEGLNQKRLAKKSSLSHTTVGFFKDVELNSMNRGKIIGNVLPLIKVSPTAVRGNTPMGRPYVKAGFKAAQTTRLQQQNPNGPRPRRQASLNASRRQSRTAEAAAEVDRGRIMYEGLDGPALDARTEDGASHDSTSTHSRSGRKRYDDTTVVGWHREHFGKPIRRARRWFKKHVKGRGRVRREEAAASAQAEAQADEVVRADLGQ